MTGSSCEISSEWIAGMCQSQLPTCAASGERPPALALPPPAAAGLAAPPPSVAPPPAASGPGPAPLSRAPPPPASGSEAGAEPLPATPTSGPPSTSFASAVSRLVASRPSAPGPVRSTTATAHGTCAHRHSRPCLLRQSRAGALLYHAAHTARRVAQRHTAPLATSSSVSRATPRGAASNHCRVLRAGEAHFDPVSSDPGMVEWCSSDVHSLTEAEVVRRRLVTPGVPV